MNYWLFAAWWSGLSVAVFVAILSIYGFTVSRPHNRDGGFQVRALAEISAGLIVIAILLAGILAVLLVRS